MSGLRIVALGLSDRLFELSVMNISTGMSLVAVIIELIHWSIVGEL